VTSRVRDEVSFLCGALGGGSPMCPLPRHPKRPSARRALPRQRRLPASRRPAARCLWPRHDALPAPQRRPPTLPAPRDGLTAGTPTPAGHDAASAGARVCSGGGRGRRQLADAGARSGPSAEPREARAGFGARSETGRRRRSPVRATRRAARLLACDGWCLAARRLKFRSRVVAQSPRPLRGFACDIS
jgi:hypothetical protein